MFSGSLVSNLLTFAFYVVISHTLPVYSLGVLYSLNLVSGFALTFLLLSLPGGFSRFIVGYFQTGRLSEARYLFRRSILFATLICLAATPALVFLAPTITSWLFGATAHLVLFYLVVADFVFTTYNSFIGVAVSARRIFGFGSAMGVVSTTVRVGSAVALIYLGYGLISVLYGWIAADIVSLGANLYFSRPLLVGDAAKSNVWDVFVYSLPFFVASGLVVVLQNVDRLFVLKYLGTISLGVYGTLLIASNIPKLLPNSLSSTLFPAMIKFEEERGLTRGVVSKAVRYMAMINLPVLGLVAALGQPLLHLFLGRSFYGSWTAFSILVFGGGAMSLDIPITQVLLAKKKTRVLAAQQLASSFTLAMLAVLLIPRVYLDGAALAYVLARLAGFAVVGYNVYRLGLFSVRWRDYAGSFGVTALLFFATVGVEVYTGFRLMLLPVYASVGVLVGVVGARALRLLRAEDHDEVVDFFPKQLRGLAAYLWDRLGFPRVVNDA